MNLVESGESNRIERIAGIKQANLKQNESINSTEWIEMKHSCLSIIYVLIYLLVYVYNKTNKFSWL